MRLPNEPMTTDEFETALIEAQQGIVSSDLGASEEIEDILSRIARADDADRPALILEARRIREGELTP